MLTPPLRQKYPKKWDIPVLLSASLILLIFGLTLPAIFLKELILWKSTFSVISGIIRLFQEGHTILGAIIILFSIVFPIFKLCIMGTVWFCKMTDQWRTFCVTWLGIVGKWSMLDVFVVAVTIVIAKISKFADAQPLIGIYLFCASIMLAMICTERIEKLLKKI